MTTIEPSSYSIRIDHALPGPSVRTFDLSGAGGMTVMGFTREVSR
jgi:hypothetical protein